MFGQLTPILLGAAFITVGTLLLSPIISPEVHDKVVQQFDGNFRANPLIEHKVIKTDAETYRKAVAVTSIVCGILILIGPYVLLQTAYIVMTLVLAVDLYCHIKLDHKAREVGPSICFLFVTLMQLFASRRVVHVKTE